MNSNDSVYVGIDPASGNMDFSYAVLDSSLNLVTLADADMDEMVTYLGSFDAAVVAINSPSRVNQGVVKKMLEDEHNKPGGTFRGADVRLAEYELRRRGITITGTPSREEFCPACIVTCLRMAVRFADESPALPILSPSHFPL